MGITIGKKEDNSKNKKKEPAKKKNEKAEQTKVLEGNVELIQSQNKELMRREKFQEETLSSLRNKINVINSNMLDNQKLIDKKVKTIENIVKEQKKLSEETKETIHTIIKEIRTLGKKQDIEALEKYIDFWNPIKFVTNTEVEKIISSQLDEKVDEEALKREFLNRIDNIVEQNMDKIISKVVVNMKSAIKSEITKQIVSSLSAQQKQ